MSHWRYLLIWPGVANKFGRTGADDLDQYVRTEYRDEIDWWGYPRVKHWLADSKWIASRWEDDVNAWARGAGLKWTHPTDHKAPEWGFHGEWTKPEAAAETLAYCARHVAGQKAQLTLF